MADEKEQNRGLREEEVSLWDHVTKNDKRWKDVQKASSTEEFAEDTNPEQRVEELEETIKKPKVFSTREAPKIELGSVKGLDGRTGERLKRGQIRYEDILDMHGMTQSEALYSLKDFIKHNYELQRRCVLVITGKGTKPDGSIGVLRQNMPRWVNEIEIRPMILAINNAQPKDGGLGAFYILLKRDR